MTFYEEGSGLPDHVLDIADETPALDTAVLARTHPAGASLRR
jgi:hypothetical protein